MEEAGDLLEASWFFENLLNTKSRTMSRCYSDLSSSSFSNQEPVKNERKSSSFSSRKSEPVASETQVFLTKNPNPGPGLTQASSMSTSVVGSDRRDHVNVEKERKSPSFSSRKQRPVAPLPTSVETRSSLTKKPIPGRCLTRASSMMASVVVSDHEDEEEDQESEFTLGRLIRQASMKSSHTLNPSRQTAKPITENLQKRPELYQEKVGDMGSMERNRSKNIKNSGKNNGGGGGGGSSSRGGGGGAPVIPGGWVDKGSSEDMKAHIKFWARAVASNVRQECS